MELPPEIKLEKNETIKEIFPRKYESYVFPGIIIAIVAILVFWAILEGFFAYISVSSTSLSFIFPLAQPGLISLILILFVIVGIITVLGYFYCKSHRYILTNTRIIIFKKFIFMSQREVKYSRITDLLLNVGIFGRLLGFGTIIPISGAMETALAPSLSIGIIGVPDPLKVFDMITDFIKGEPSAELAPLEAEEVEEEIEEAEEIESLTIPKQIRLFPEEKIVLILKRRYLSFFFTVIWVPIFLTIILLLIVFFIRPMFTNQVLFLDPTMFLIVSLSFDYIQLFFGIGIFLGILALGLGYFYTRGHFYVITDQRIMMICIFVYIWYRELDYADISDIVVSQGPFGRIFNYGNCQPLTLGMEYGAATYLSSLTGIPNPQDARTKILNLLSTAKEKLF
ncbi:MAG: PH domain-containing protein [Candidatus Helarchaeales archaeon]